MDTSILEFDHVSGKKGKFRLQDIHFALPAGYIMGLMGANGAGKSTLFDYIMNESVRYEGHIRIDGVDIRENHAYIKNKIGFVSEENAFLEDGIAKFTTQDNARLLGRFYEQFEPEIFNGAMEEMQVSLNRPYGRLSRGEKLKFQMAFAMAHHARIYLLDEVTVGMDPVFRLDFFKILQRVIETEQASVLMTSHIESEMKQKTDYLGILQEGRLIQFGESLDTFFEAGRSL